MNPETIEIIKVTTMITTPLIGVAIAAMQIYATANIKAMGKEQGKIKKQIENLPELQQIAEAQASGKHGVEYKYHQKKIDAEKMMEFAEKIIQATMMMKNESHKSLLKCAALHQCVITQQDMSPLNILTKVKPLVTLDEFNSLITQALIMYKLYFEHYDNCTHFKGCIAEWEDAIRSMATFSLQTVQDIRNEIMNEDNRLVVQEHILDILKNRNVKLPEILLRLNNAEENLIHSLSEIIKEIRHKNI